MVKQNFISKFYKILLKFKFLW